MKTALKLAGTVITLVIIGMFWILMTGQQYASLEELEDEEYYGI